MKFSLKIIALVLVNLFFSVKLFSQGSCGFPHNMGTIGTGSTCASFFASGTTGSAPCAGPGYGGSGGVTYIRFCTGATVRCINFVITDGTSSGNWAVTVYSANCSVSMDVNCMGTTGTGSSYNTANPTTPLQPNTCYVARFWVANAGSFSICAQAMAPPNDFCPAATPIGPAVLPANNFCMTALSPGDPAPAAFCAGSLENNAWYTFTTSLSCVAPCTVVVTVSNIICSGGGAGFQIGYFTGVCGSLTNIGCTSGSGGTVTATITGLTPGQVVTIGLDGNAGANCTYGISASNTTPVLPIELMNFIVTKNVGYIGLNWSTATETNNDYYTIEKTIDGKTFETVAVIDGGGTSLNARNYSYNDQNPYLGISYYRLKQTDYDNSSTHSEMRAVEYKNDIKLNFDIVPNPSSGGFNLSFNSISEEDYVVEITDLSGKVIYSNITKLSNEKLTIDNDFSVGMYLLSVRNLSTDLSIGTKKLLISE